MGCCNSKSQEKPKPNADSAQRNSQSPQAAKKEASSPPPSAPAQAPAPPKKSPPRLELPRSSASKKDPKTYKSAHITITTVYEEKDIIKLEQTPRGTIKKSVHFNCPVCLSYYNVILSAKCCKNYLCHQCAKDLLDRDLKEAKVKGNICPSCQHERLELVDVDPAASVKLYTDTFVLSKKDKVAAGAEEEDEDGLEVRDSPLLGDEPDNRV